MKKYYLLLSLISSFLSFSQKEVIGIMKTEIIQKKELKYVLHIPEINNTKKPLIIFLHGSGEKGDDLEKVKNIGPFQFLKNHELDAYILGPQCPENEYWDAEMIFRLIEKIKQENNIDPNRIYLTGLSMGAWATWNLAYAHPEIFAAIITIAGYVDRIPMVENCKISAIPIQIFHGLLDDIVSVDYSINIYKKLKACNANVELTLFEDANHDSWSRVYNNQKIYDWMFKQIKKQ